MKITKQRLKQIIKEELEAVISERFDPRKQAPKKLTFIELTKQGRNYRYKVGGGGEAVEGKFSEVGNVGYTALSFASGRGFFLDKHGIRPVKVKVNSDNPSTESQMKQELEKETQFKGQFEEMMQEREKLKQDIKRRQEYEQKNYGKVLTKDLPGG